MSGSIHVALAALGAAIGVGLIGMKAAEAVSHDPNPSTKVLVQVDFWPSPLPEAIVFYAIFLVRWSTLNKSE